MLQISLVCNAQYVNFNYDTKTFLQVNANTAAIVAQEGIHNIMVDSIKQKQTKIAELVGWISANRMLFQQSLQNIKGFGKESNIYKSMYAVGGDIINHSVKALDLVSKSNMTQKVNIVIHISTLVASAASVGEMFADIITNSTVKNPVQTEESAKSKGKGDRHNLLSRDERVTMANQLLKKLKEIDGEILHICYLARFSNLSDLIRTIDPETWQSMVWGKIKVNEIIRKWNGIKN